jgi:ABC-type nitrate/sulfonate/bicarbonate transport system substrate-binding protein
MKIHLALDWFANTTHTGFYMAEALGYYDDRFLQIEFISPQKDNYKSLPSQKVIDGLAHFALVPPESIIDNHDKWNSQLIALATVFQENISSFAVREDSNIFTAKDFIHKRYAALGLPYEEYIVQSFIAKAGGIDGVKPITVNRLNTWESLINKEADICWIFDTWEKIEAQYYHQPIRTIRMEEVGLAYGYSPLLVTSKPFLGTNQNAFYRFVEATALGFQYAAEHPEEAAKILYRATDLHQKYEEDFIIIAQKKASSLYLNKNKEWGVMTPKIWRDYFKMIANALTITKDLDVNTLYTNAILKFPLVNWD